MSEIKKSYRFLSVGFLLVLLTTALSPLYVSNNIVKKSQAEQKEENNEEFVAASTSDAVVQAVKLDLNKKFVFVKNILINEARSIIYIIQPEEVLPKILQTLFVSAIPKNAP